MHHRHVYRSTNDPTLLVSGVPGRGRCRSSVAPVHRRMIRRWPSRSWAVAELMVALALMAGGLHGYFRFSVVPWMWAAATVLLWWRGPFWPDIGLRRPTRQAIVVGVIVG